MNKQLVSLAVCVALLLPSGCLKDQPFTPDSSNSLRENEALAQTPIPKTEYSLYQSTGNGGASYTEVKAWDGSNTTFWCSPYLSGQTKPFPQFLSINLAKAYNISTIKYRPRQDASRGRIINYEILVVKTGSTAWQTVKTGTFPNSTAEQTVTFALQTGVTKFQMKANTVYQQTTYPYTCIAELTLMQDDGVFYTINASAGPNGTISPIGAVQVAQAGSQAFNFIPNYLYLVDKVTVDGLDLPNPVANYSFTNVQKNCSIHVTFKPDTFTITASAGANGTISPAGAQKVPAFGSKIFTFLPNPGYTVNTLTVNGAAVANPGTSYQFANVQSNNTINVTFKPVSTYYTIVASAGPNGAIDPAGAVQVAEGANQTFTFTPNFPYTVDKLTVDGIEYTTPGTSYTFESVNKNSTINITFKLATFTINASSGPNGTISPSGAVQVPAFGNQTFTFTPDPGYLVDKLTIDGTVIVDPGLSYSFQNVLCNLTVTVSFKPIGGINYTINASVNGGIGGTISPSGQVSVPQGNNQTFTATPSTGYKLVALTVDGSTVQGSSYTFTNVQQNHTIVASFSVITYTITASVNGGIGGTISPSGQISVPQGNNQTFTAAPATGYKLDALTVDGGTVQGSSYTFANVQQNHTIVASFSTITYTITASAGTNGTIAPVGAVQVAQGGSRSFTFTPNSGYVVNQVTVDGVVVTPSGNTYTITNVQANKTINVTFKVSGVSICDGVKQWTASDPWTSYKIGDKRVNGTPSALYECTNTGYSYWEPSGPYGSYGWKKLGNCQ